MKRKRERTAKKMAVSEGILLGKYSMYLVGWNAGWRSFHEIALKLDIPEDLVERIKAEKYLMYMKQVVEMVEVEKIQERMQLWT